MLTMKRHLLAVVCLSIACSAQAQVKVDMKPGLWENTITMDGEGVKQMEAMHSSQMQQAMEEMKRQMANMPAEQRKMMEEAMAASGIHVNEDSVSLANGQVNINKNGMLAKQCITQEEIDRGEVADVGDECQSTLTQIAKNRFKSTQVCTGENSSTTETEIVFHSPTHYTGKGSSSQVFNGQQYSTNITMEGKWIDSDCGDILPATYDDE
ncbi:DUF3617 domain-containing protein [Cellvibrio japonicus]|nr:DUF3617 domain-containing protein [Cellvibrio japonicus]QEI15319.1 DUF3617 domain-containing protein [Cellvibrio japonicus]QEI18899.1 DUF3617 domain-containing protein [Cellvibrio japonicus]